MARQIILTFTEVGQHVQIHANWVEGRDTATKAENDLAEAIRAMMFPLVVGGADIVSGGKSKDEATTMADLEMDIRKAGGDLGG